MKWISVDSSCVDSIAYDKRNKFIYVKFRNDRGYDPTNRIYRYPDCSEQEFNEFLNCDSKGQYVYYILRPNHGDGERIQ